MKPRKPIRKVSKRQQERLKEYRKVRTAFLKQNPACAKCMSTDKTVDVHHTRGRLGDLLCYTPFFIQLCRECHCWVHECPAMARHQGFLCPKGQWNNTKLIEQ